MNAIRVCNLSKKYKEKTAVDDISFEIQEGELFGLLGVNGAGKTTTIKMLSGLVDPTNGEAYIFDYNIKKDSKKAKELLNVSPQETAVAPNLTVEENLSFILGIYTNSLKEQKERVDEYIKQFGLEEVRKNKAQILSGGYQRRLSIAMALITQPKVVFLDEPTLGLDVLARRELWKIIENLKGKITVILTTHYMEEAETLTDRIGIMKDGKIVDIDTASNFIKKTDAKNFEDAFVKIVEGAS